MAEAMVAMTLMTVAGTALLLDTSSLIDSTDANMREFVATALAQQLMDEVAGKRYMEAGTAPDQWPMGPGADELGGPGRSQFDDLDDYNGVRAQPPVDRWGIPLGNDDGDATTRASVMQLNSGYLTNFEQQVDVFYVADTALTTPLASGVTSNYRAVRVQIVYHDPSGTTQTLASLWRVFSYVPSN
jgi:hypothetical protein